MISDTEYMQNLYTKLCFIRQLQEAELEKIVAWFEENSLKNLVITVS